mmetsp:Transcript_11933/g.14438  ORF Transcript_11933/g.14438 Transcript_11933/m.14438 type:complete len:186 (+) Transcript_11933:44-601(+)
MYSLLIFLAFLSFNEGYPIGTLRCCNTLARPDNFDQCVSKIGRATICSQTRNTVCIVEKVVGFSESTCGKTDSGDFGTWQNYQPNDGTYSKWPVWPFRWDATHGECVYRKCDEQCPDGDTKPGSQKTGSSEFEYEGEIYRRVWYCCNDRDMCNSAMSSKGVHVALVVGLVTVMATFLSTFEFWFA